DQAFALEALGALDHFLLGHVDALPDDGERRRYQGNLVLQSAHQLPVPLIDCLHSDPRRKNFLLRAWDGVDSDCIVILSRNHHSSRGGMGDSSGVSRMSSGNSDGGTFSLDKATRSRCCLAVFSALSRSTPLQRTGNAESLRSAASNSRTAPRCVP